MAAQLGLRRDNFPNYDPSRDEPITREKFEAALKSKDTLETFMAMLLDKFRFRLSQIVIPHPVSKGDITKVQLEDMEEKIQKLMAEVEEFKNAAEKEDSTYRRLTEACVKYSIQLDRINVIGRDLEREQRKKMLINVDHLSTELVKINEDYKMKKQ